MSLASLQMPLGVPGYQYETAAQMAEGLALRVAEALRTAVSERGRALLVVSGGRSPIPFFECLARQELPWSKVQVSLADERWVPPSHADSNEALVRRHLLQGPAAQATMLGLYHPAQSLDEAARLAEQSVAGLPPIDVLVLGMGDDGHTASLFPQSPLLTEALSADCSYAVLPMQAPAAPHERLSLTLPALTGAHLQLLAIQGASKLATLELALQSGAAEELPIRALLRPPLQVHWSP
ncbi:MULTISPECIES: 6-phosphogluconolactonase [unclassified Pseudomonas]|uniref:6-phosphogluconolactonase n=1 Tax=unclassified Pseudomonas TaxID=196821 RepID=UPI00244A5891|nr:MULTISPECIES: 6-phosphogluconolactonase [unclassified Pseudomonas]MDG9926245.1 6-phosphogluconolactonase [Pseudomonas sp. GD04045]MDH0037350.1 6-phosphogluconolactonase [Pseudomonas sp. GD04019]